MIKFLVNVQCFMLCVFSSQSYVLPDTSKKSYQKTRVIKRDTNPVFNHTIVYDGFHTEDLKDACVELTVWDHEKLTNHFLGGIRLGLGTGQYFPLLSYKVRWEVAEYFPVGEKPGMGCHSNWYRHWMEGPWYHGNNSLFPHFLPTSDLRSAKTQREFSCCYRETGMTNQHNIGAPPREEHSGMDWNVTRDSTT